MQTFKFRLIFCRHTRTKTTRVRSFPDAITIATCAYIPSAAVLPSQAHPSYPYGNPYKPHLAASPSRRAAAARAAAFEPSTHSASLATTLPTLELRELFERTTFGDAPDRQWHELHLGGLFGRKTRAEQEEDAELRDALQNAHGDAGQPAGQNAGDAPEEESDGEGADMDEEGSQDGQAMQ